MLEQLFARGYAEGGADEGPFPEYVPRPEAGAGDEVAITFAAETGKGFYAQIADAVAEDDHEPFFDFSAMPKDWTVPEPAPRADAA